MDNGRILDSIATPADLKVLTDEELAILAREIREQIIDTTSHTGGHVASSLGAVELILALHSLLDCPTDKLVFDVGHQAYAHKLVTGRAPVFDTLRTRGGISGFPKPSESPYDVHPSGHASDSLSVAAGLAQARVMNGTNERVVAVIGDGSLSGGMAFEALNYIGQEQLPMIIVLNDNEMSISRNVGALMRHLGNIRANSHYRNARDDIQERLESTGALGMTLSHLGKSMKESLKQFVIPHTMIFESLGIVCTAPIDGHNIRALRETFEVVLDAEAPILVHVVTKKGAGYAPAEKDPERFHGVGPFDRESGAALPSAAMDKAKTFTDAFSEVLVREAREDDRIVAITAAMEGGTGLKAMASEFPERFIDVGIAEENAVGMASGLAIGGKKPLVAIYSTFLQRAVDQMIINCALPDLDVVFAIDRAGIVGADGVTHNGVYDMVYARMIPNMRILAPSDENELSNAFHTAFALGGPFSVRYPRGKGAGVDMVQPAVLEPGKSRTLREGSDAAILAFGPCAYRALEAAEQLEAQGVSARVVDMRWVKPLDEQAVCRAAELGTVVTVEEGALIGGAGEAVLETIAAHGLHCNARVLGIPDEFVSHGETGRVLQDLGLDADGIARAVLEALNGPRSVASE